MNATVTGFAKRRADACSKYNAGGAAIIVAPKFILTGVYKNPTLRLSDKYKPPVRLHLTYLSVLLDLTNKLIKCLIDI